MTNFRRTRHFLWQQLLLLILTCWSVHPAHATTIASGQTKTGSITGTGHNDYTFRASEGSSFVVAIAETGNHHADFLPVIELVPPGDAAGRLTGNSLHSRLVQENAAEGTWTVRVSRADDSGASGGYALRLLQMPGASGTAMSAGHSYEGTNSRGAIDVYTFTGTAGHTAKLTLTATGGTGFIPEIFVYTPAGVSAGGVNCVETCFQDFALTADGTYTVLAWRDDANDVNGTYTLSLSDSQ